MAVSYTHTRCIVEASLILFRWLLLNYISLPVMQDKGMASVVIVGYYLEYFSHDTIQKTSPCLLLMMSTWLLRKFKH